MVLTQSGEHFKIRNFLQKERHKDSKHEKDLKLDKDSIAGCETEGPHKRKCGQLLGAKTNPQLAVKKDSEMYNHKELDSTNLNGLRS